MNKTKLYLIRFEYNSRWRITRAYYESVQHFLNYGWREEFADANCGVRIFLHDISACNAELVLNSEIEVEC